MCVVAFAWRAHPRWRLVLIGNRDEFHGRPSAAVAPWPGTAILAGRDLQAGGTWAGVDEHGRCAVVTNIRADAGTPAARSRGDLPIAFLTSAPDPGTRQALADEITAAADQYAPFNLLLADRDQCQVLSNRPRPAVQAVAPGIHGLTNGGFLSHWPKAQALCRALARWLNATAADTEVDANANDLAPLWTALQDRQPFPDQTLPDTGVGLALERRLSPVFINGSEYGTRACTLIAIDQAGKGWIRERRFGPEGVALGESQLAIG